MAAPLHNIYQWYIEIVTTILRCHSSGIPSPSRTLAYLSHHGNYFLPAAINFSDSSKGSRSFLLFLFFNAIHYLVPAYTIHWNFFRIMIPINFFIHDPVHVIVSALTSNFLTERQLFLPSSHTPLNFSIFTICLQSFYQSRFSIWAIFNSVGSSFQPSFSLLFGLLSLLCSSCSVACSYSPHYYTYTLPCVYLFFVDISFFTFSFHHRVSSLFLLPVFPHTTHHMHLWPHLWNIPIILTCQQ